MEKRFSGKKLKKARNILGLSLKRLGKKSGVSRISIYNYETGKSVPGGNIVAKMGDALNMPLEYFYE